MFTLQEQESTVIKTNLFSSSGRHIFWRFYFGTVPDWQRIEGDIFNMMAKLCHRYQGAFWDSPCYRMGGFYLA
ncbi:hypothetical protein [Providencia hangzhouensis]|uniref:hypothetical protein n=1 Tax=Providencia hangzhouensis TaxID=3031799 RepID=UPI0034DD77C8